MTTNQDLMNYTKKELIEMLESVRGTSQMFFESNAELDRKIKEIEAEHATKSRESLYRESELERQRDKLKIEVANAERCVNTAIVAIQALIAVNFPITRQPPLDESEMETPSQELLSLIHIRNLLSAPSSKLGGRS